MESSTKQFRKRNAILNCLMNTDTHPSAEMVYQMLQETHPDISQATVYRNLALFKKQGLIVSVGTVNGQERFDATVKPHAHFICKDCGSVMDFHGLEQDVEMDRQVEEKFGMKIDHHELVFYGTCPHCI